MKITLRGIFLPLFLLFNIGDVVTTFMVYFKHPVFNEAHPLVVLGLPFGLMVLLKLGIILFLFWFCMKRYYLVKSPLIRYILIYYIVLMVFMNFAVCINNINVYNTPSEQIVPVPDDVKTEYYNEAVNEMGVLDNITPKIPLLYFIFIINMIQFIVWQSFEKYRRKQLSRYYCWKHLKNETSVH